eukprot:Nk52_evm53s152 gene=Nk52_evmTU53s152
MHKEAGTGRDHEMDEREEFRENSLGRRCERTIASWYCTQNEENVWKKGRELGDVERLLVLPIECQMRIVEAIGIESKNTFCKLFVREKCIRVWTKMPDSRLTLIRSIHRQKKKELQLIVNLLVTQVFINCQDMLQAFANSTAMGNVACEKNLLAELKPEAPSLFSYIYKTQRKEPFWGGVENCSDEEEECEVGGVHGEEKKATKDDGVNTPHCRTNWEEEIVCMSWDQSNDSLEHYYVNLAQSIRKTLLNNARVVKRVSEALCGEQGPSLGDDISLNYSLWKEGIIYTRNLITLLKEIGFPKASLFALNTQAVFFDVWSLMYSVWCLEMPTLNVDFAPPKDSKVVSIFHLESLFLKASCFLDLDDYSSAVEYFLLFERFFPHCSREAEPNHYFPSLFNSRVDLAFAYYYQCNYLRCWEEISSALAILKKATGIETREDKVSQDTEKYSSKKTTYCIIEKVHDSDALLWTNAFKNTDIKSVIDAWIIMYMIQFHRQKFVAARKTIQDALSLTMTAFRKSHPYFAEVLHRVSDYHMRVDLPELAILNLRKAIQIEEQIYGTESLTLAKSYKDLAYSLYVQNYNSGHFEEANVYANKSIAIYMRILGHFNVKIAHAFRIAALIIEECAIDLEPMDNRKSWMLENSLKLHEQSLSICTHILGNTNISTAKAYGNLGRLYQTLGQNEMAEANHKKCINLKRQIIGNTDSEIAVSLGHLAAVYTYNMGKYKEAEELYLESIMITKRANGELYTCLEYDYMGLIKVYSALKQWDKKREYEQILSMYKAKVSSFS